jgi:hypothetical protein
VAKATRLAIATPTTASAESNEVPEDWESDGLDKWGKTVGTLSSNGSWYTAGVGLTEEGEGVVAYRRGVNGVNDSSSGSSELRPLASLHAAAPLLIRRGGEEQSQGVGRDEAMDHRASAAAASRDLAEGDYTGLPSRRLLGALFPTGHLRARRTRPAANRLVGEGASMQLPGLAVSWLHLDVVHHGESCHPAGGCGAGGERVCARLDIDDRPINVAPPSRHVSTHDYAVTCRPCCTRTET